MTSPAATHDELLALSRALLDSIAAADWDAYARLCADDLTCFEPEARGHLIHGLPFHKFYFDLGPARQPRLATLVDPHVRVMGDVAVVSYKRVTQSLDGGGQPQTSAMEETRVWQRRDGRWQHVHFHRSAAG